MRLLRYKLAAFAEMEQSLAETAIGEEVDESSSTSPERETSENAVDAAAPSSTDFDISAVTTDIGSHQQQLGDSGLSGGLGTLHEM